MGEYGVCAGRRVVAEKNDKSCSGIGCSQYLNVFLYIVGYFVTSKL